MEASSVTVEQPQVQTDTKNSILVQSKLLDSISTVDNSREICVSNIHGEIQNSQIYAELKEKSNQNIPENLDHSAERAPIDIGESSQQSEGEGVPNNVKPGREQKFKRSTNNSHKKFISVARRWLFKNYRGELKSAFESKFNAFRSTRTYFFIILAFIRTIMTEEKQKLFQGHFSRQVGAKIVEYEKQISNTENDNLKHFRTDEVTDLKFSIKASDVYFQGDIDKSIECVYKKDKTTIVKKHHYEEAIKTVKSIQQEFLTPNFVEDMINIYGCKKTKSRSTCNEESSGKGIGFIHTKKTIEKFLVPEMFGHKSFFTFEQEKSAKNDKEMRMTMQCEEQENLNIEWMLKDRSSLHAQSLGLTPMENKKMVNLVVISPRTQLDEQVKIDSIIQRKFSFSGFRPYLKQ